MISNIKNDSADLKRPFF